MSQVRDFGSLVIAGDEPGGEVRYIRDYVTPPRRRELLSELEGCSDQFEQGVIMAGEREIPTPRLVAAFGDDAFAFPDMGASAPWLPSIAAVKVDLEAQAGHPFNYALVNWYRDGSDYTGWHADKMHLHEPGTSVAVVSLGVTRPMRFRRLPDLVPAADFLVEDGSLLWMRGSPQKEYEHAIPAIDDLPEPRFSITFRCLLTQVQP
jgi:hypothetical protein